MTDSLDRCPQPQCQASDAKTLHSGYVTHRNKGEDACEASTTGHNRYMKDKRIAKQRSLVAFPGEVGKP